MDRTEYKAIVGHFRRETRSMPEFDKHGMLTPMVNIFIGDGDAKVMIYRHAGPGNLASACRVTSTARNTAAVLVGLISHEKLFKDKLTRKSILNICRGLGAGGNRVPIPG